MKKLSFFLYIICIAVSYSASTGEIESLRLRLGDSSAQLTTSDKAIITEFWSKAIGELMLSDSSKDCVETRMQLAQQKGDGYLSNYAVAYVEEAKKAIETAFSDARRIQDPLQRQMVERNLMILVAELKSPSLAPLGLERLGAEDNVVRYWAYKSVTNSSLAQQLASDIVGDERITKSILAALKEQIPLETQTQALEMVVRFCMRIDDPVAREILILIADRRIEAYRDWSVNDESLDTDLLNALGSVAMLQGQPDKKLFGQKFAELYASAIQRYLKGQDVLSESQTDELLSVIAEVDQGVLGDTIGIRTGILTALKRKTGMEREYETLFGDRMRRGQLAELFKFDYGKDDSGNPVTAPPELGPMPEKMKTDK